MKLSSREKLALTAAKLFQERGYQGVGLAEILAASGLPKGSLYHHFPNGKSDLALEAAELAHREMARIVDEAFDNATSFREGTTTLLFKLAKLFDIMGKSIGCPVSEILFGGPDQEKFRARSAEYFEAWTAQITAHAERLGEEQKAARVQAERLFVILQGGWTLARANQDADILRKLPELIFCK